MIKTINVSSLWARTSVFLMGVILLACSAHLTHLFLSQLGSDMNLWLLPLLLFNTLISGAGFICGLIFMETSLTQKSKAKGSEDIKREDEEECPDCGVATLRAKSLSEGGGVKCRNPDCSYWFCF